MSDAPTPVNAGNERRERGALRRLRRHLSPHVERHDIANQPAARAHGAFHQAAGTHGGADLPHGGDDVGFLPVAAGARRKQPDAQPERRHRAIDCRSVGIRCLYAKHRGSDRTARPHRRPRRHRLCDHRRCQWKGTGRTVAGPCAQGPVAASDRRQRGCGNHFRRRRISPASSTDSAIRSRWRKSGCVPSPISPILHPRRPGRPRPAQSRSAMCASACRSSGSASACAQG